ncbi:MAG: hypothetical protein JJ920_00395 [Roseitalea sp.]|jgi:hypothetical protein|nr:hypothetical protein [Roseitalea sp.]MBO6741336.1 hypothetical protein [Roseitalea sp.]
MTARTTPFFSAVIAVILAATPAHADGIAFVQALEQGSGVATGATMEEAFGRAVAQCTETGALEEDCIRTNWCAPAGFSVDVFLQHSEGPHWHEVVCGLPDEQIARTIGETLCDRDARPYLIECAVVQVYDPDGGTLMEW